ncbi:MAG: Mur ligase family protein, partial [bacterium]
MDAAVTRPLALATLLRRAGLLVPRYVGRGTISGIAHDSRRVSKGAFFCAMESVSGRDADILAHVNEAVRGGAVAVLADPKVLKRTVLGAGVAALPCADVRGAYARLCAAFYGFPARRLGLSGITGTNGKTTTSFLLRGLLDPQGLRSALVGTVGYWVGRRFQPAPNTTPSALELQALLAAAVRRGCRFAVMEVSSHALDQRRVEGLTFKAAVFTNLTRDHLDYHKTLAAYARAKARLFS